MEKSIYIYAFGKEHSHNIEETSSFTMGLLMGIGGVRGMLITLGAIHGGDVQFGNGWTIYLRSYDSICLFWTLNFIYKSELFRQYYKCKEGIYSSWSYISNYWNRNFNRIGG